MQIRTITKRLLALLMVAAASLENPSVRATVLSNANRYPHLLSFLTFAIPALLCLHNPMVQEALGIKIEQTQTTTSTEVVPISPLKPQA